MSEIAFFIFAIYLILTLVGFITVFRIQRKSLSITAYTDLHDADLLHLVTTRGGISERGAICSAMISDNRSLFENHIKIEITHFLETGQLSQYIRQHFIDVLNGKVPLITEDNQTIIVA